MADITEIKLPDATVFTVKDPNAQPSTLTTPLTINGNTETMVEDALDRLNDYGDALKDNLAANENVYGAKNLIPFPYEDGMSKTFRGVNYTVANNGSVASANTATRDGWFSFVSNIALSAGTYIITGCPSGGSNSSYYLKVSITRYGGAPDSAYDTGNGATFTLNDGDVVNTIYIGAANGTDMSGLTFYPMLRDARVIDPTFAPFAKTNLQLTNDKAERADIATINVTGSTNTTGAQIDAGTFFYLNGSLCKALTNIAANATFTLNTNYEEVTVGGELANMAFHKIVENGTYSTVTADTWEYTGVSFTIPAKTFYGLRGESGWQNGRPTGLAISVANDALRTYECLALYEDANGAAYCSATGYSAANLTVYLWSKRQGTGSNPYTLNGWYVNE